MTILQKICCYFLLAKLFLYLCPDEKYEAYFSLLLEWTLLFVIVFSVIGSNQASDVLERGQILWNEMLMAAEDGKQELTDEALADYIERLFDEEVINQIKEDLPANQETVEQDGQEGESEEKDAEDNRNYVNQSDVTEE